MVLLVGGVVLDESPRDIRCFLRSHPYLKDTAGSLLSIATKVVGPVGLLYVSQREFAATIPHDKNVTLLGTEDATTCLMAILRHTVSGATALGHFDSTAHHEGIRMMVHRIQELSLGYPEGRIEAIVVGAYADPRGVSEELIANVFYAMHKNPVEIDLVTACVLELNTTLRGTINFPIIYGIAVNVKTREIFPATFPEQGPELPLRNARLYTGEHAMLEIYDYNMGLLRIGPFNYEPMRGVDLWLEQNDDFIRQHLSTSPDVEPPGFSTQVRLSLKHIQEHPFPLVTIFPDNKPHFFRKDESGAWVQVRY